jgi:hypothetical protein
MPNSSWTAQQLRILKKEYPLADKPRVLAKCLRKTYSALKAKAGVLGLHRKKRAGSPWTAAKERKLVKL